MDSFGAKKKPTTPIVRYRCGLRMAEGFNHSEPIQWTGGSIGLQEKNEHTTGSIVDEFINSESNTRGGVGKKKLSPSPKKQIKI